MLIRLLIQFLIVFAIPVLGNAAPVYGGGLYTYDAHFSVDTTRDRTPSRDVVLGGPVAIAEWSGHSPEAVPLAARGGAEVVQRAMSRAELEATRKTGLLRGGRSGTHHVSDAVNSSGKRAQQRLSLSQTPEVRATLEVPAGRMSTPSKVQSANGMPGGGMERTATGPVPARIIRVDEYGGT